MPTLHGPPGRSTCDSGPAAGPSPVRAAVFISRRLPPALTAPNNCLSCLRRELWACACGSDSTEPSGPGGVLCCLPCLGAPVVGEGAESICLGAPVVGDGVESIEPQGSQISETRWL